MRQFRQTFFHFGNVFQHLISRFFRIPAIEGLINTFMGFNNSSREFRVRLQYLFNILQEILTVKSDDVYGRAKLYESIVKGDNLPEPNVPESFNVLVRELMGLGLDIKIE